MKFLKSLLLNLRENGHRVLIFSRSKLILTMIQSVLREQVFFFFFLRRQFDVSSTQNIPSILYLQGQKYLRIDGEVADRLEREKYIETFNEDPSYFCFLLTTEVGGIGINLTSADRVIICNITINILMDSGLELCKCVNTKIIISIIHQDDPSWNPAKDSQAIDRAYRVGQKKEVVVYRLVSCGTVEEKIYRKQVFKTNLAKTATNRGNNMRYVRNK